MNKNLHDFEEKIGIKFKNLELLKIALTHTSYSEEHSSDENLDEKKINNNERLEFLGDSVLSIIISTYLYNKYVDWREGQLTKQRSKLVSRETCYNWAKMIGIGDFLLLGIGEEKTAGREKLSNLANVFEALLGAIYLDQGLCVAEKFILFFLDKTSIEDAFYEDYKSELQEKIQKFYKISPTYEIISEKGPPHNKIFTIQVKLKEKILGNGSGKNKKQAQQIAAKNALAFLKNENDLL